MRVARQPGHSETQATSYTRPMLTIRYIPDSEGRPCSRSAANMKRSPATNKKAFLSQPSDAFSLHTLAAQRLCPSIFLGKPQLAKRSGGQHGTSIVQDHFHCGQSQTQSCLLPESCRGSPEAPALSGVTGARDPLPCLMVSGGCGVRVVLMQDIRGDKGHAPDIWLARWLKVYLPVPCGQVPLHLHGGSRQLNLGVLP